LVTFSVSTHFGAIAAIAHVAPTAAVIFTAIDEEPAAAAVAARAETRPLRSERDEHRDEKVAELGPALIGADEHAVRRERAFARAQEPLNPLPADPIVVHVTKQPDPIEGTEHVPFLESAMLPVVLLEEAFHLSSSQNMSREPPEEALEIQVAKVWRDLGQVLARP